MPQHDAPEPRGPDTAVVVVIGGANVDLKSQTCTAPVLGTSNPGRSRSFAGGVGRNVAENLGRLGVGTQLITAFGLDADGERLRRETAAAGVDLAYSIRTSGATGRYTAIVDDTGDMVIAVAAMEAMDEITVEVIDACARAIARAAFLILDCNISETALMRAAAIARDNDVPLIIDPVSTPKASRVRAILSAGIPLHTVTPNRDELGALTGNAVPGNGDPGAAAESLHRAGATHVWVRLGSGGSYLSVGGGRPKRAEAIAPYPSTLVDATGAGDAMLAGYVAGLLHGLDPFAAARYGSAAAAMTIETAGTVNPAMGFAALTARIAAG